MAIYANILDTIGRTPIVRVNHLAPPGVNLFVKVESMNPMGSVKDRMARAVIEAAEASGALRPGQTVIEATSGNTGIALAMVCAQRGYPLVVVMAENFSIERRRLMRFLGARVVLTPASEKGSGMLEKARELARAHGWFLARQFENEANIRVHMETTAEEILADFADRQLDYWVTGAGTGGTLTGVARVLRARRPGTRIVVCEPDNAPVLASGLPQPGADASGRAPSHPMFRPHVMQGWSPDFIPAITRRAIREGLIDEIMPINGADALETARALATREGILAGISSGATLAGAIAVGRKAPPGSNVLCMIPDTGERYLSTPLFADVPAEMTEEEIAISRSTPGYRFDTPPPAPAVCSPAQANGASKRATGVPVQAKGAPAEPDVPADHEIAAWVEYTVRDPEQPVVMFALEWCEFCWSVRRLMDHLGVPYRAIPLDSVEYQAGDRGGRIRAELRRATGAPTIPQIFIGGRHVGGCTEFFDAYRSGDVARWLKAAGVDAECPPELDPYQFLPGWLQPRRIA
jgi:cysteine synthase